MQIGVGPSGPHRHFSHAQPSVSFLGVRKGQIWGEMGSEMGSPGFLLDPPRCFECHHQPAGTPISLFSFLSPQNHPECSSPSLQITHEKEKGKIPPCKTGSKTGREKGGQHPNPPPLPPPFAGILGADTTALFRGGIWAEFVVFSLCRSHRWVNHGEKEPTVKKLVVGPARSWGRTADPNPPPGLAYPVIRVLGPT